MECTAVDPVPDLEIFKLCGGAGLGKLKPVERIEGHAVHSDINNIAICQFLLFHTQNRQNIAAGKEVNNKGCTNI